MAAGRRAMSRRPVAGPIPERLSAARDKRSALPLLPPPCVCFKCSHAFASVRQDLVCPHCGEPCLRIGGAP